VGNKRVATTRKLVVKERSTLLNSAPQIEAQAHRNSGSRPAKCTNSAYSVPIIEQICDDCSRLWPYVWSSICSLRHEIDGIVRRYPYRAACYQQAGDQWVPAPTDQLSDDYDERVEEETLDSAT
jgi:NMD protein affecting ribosome stability and mRNA decay